jgi:hypothetical protein
MKRSIALTILLAAVMTPSVASAATFKNCTAVNKKYPNGVARSSAAAKMQKKLPKVSAKIYRDNVKMDRDKDGTICEK